MTPAALVLLIVCGLSNGLTDFSQKLFVSHAPESTSDNPRSEVLFSK